MPSLEMYKPSMDYSYAPGFFPAMEALNHTPDNVRRVLISSKAVDTDAGRSLAEKAASCGVRVEEADRILSRISGKENCYAAAVFAKREEQLASGKPQVVLAQASDCGNVGTILRTALGFGVEDVALIRPCADVFDPRTVRASMGAIFQLRVKTYPSYEAWQEENPDRPVYPFMLDASLPLPEVLAGEIPEDWTLIFGNEGSGLPPFYASLGQPVRIPSNDRVDSLNLSVAAAIGLYAFAGRPGCSGPRSLE